MERIQFKQLPLAVRVAVGVAFYELWWLIEEFVINRKGLGQYMPFYEVENFCIWDLTVAAVITFLIWRASRR